MVETAKGLPYAHLGRRPAESVQPLARRVRDALREHDDVRAWSLRAIDTRSRELYLARTAVEAEREVRSQRVLATLFVRDGETMGSASLTIAAGEDGRAEERVEEAVALARGGSMEPFPLPRPGPLEAVPTVDEAISERASETIASLRERLVEAVATEERVQLASAELYLHDDDERFENSEGLVADRGGTRVTSEVVLLGGGRDGAEAEFQDLRYRRRVEDLELEAWVRELSAFARDAAEARPVEDWEGPVILPADTLRSFYGPVIQQTSAGAHYLKSPALEDGAWASGEEPRGERLALATDATLPWGLDSHRCDTDGVPGQRAELIADGKLVRRWGEQRFAHYLGVEPTGAFANLTIEGGRRWDKDLRDEAGILEVFRFSWLNPNTSTGDFASEVRFGYLSRGMARMPIRGGTLIGNVFDSLLETDFSRDLAFAGNARVPKAIRIARLKLAGS